LDDGRVMCWGSNADGEIGLPPANQPFSTPQVVNGIAKARMVSSGWNYSCAALADGTVKCWGSNKGLGFVLGAWTFVPATVPSLSGVMAVSAADTHVCATLLPIGIKCWGSNMYGELTDGTTNSSPIPVP